MVKQSVTLWDLTFTYGNCKFNFPVRLLEKLREFVESESASYNIDTKDKSCDLWYLLQRKGTMLQLTMVFGTDRNEYFAEFLIPYKEFAHDVMNYKIPKPNSKRVK